MRQTREDRRIRPYLFGLLLLLLESKSSSPNKQHEVKKHLPKALPENARDDRTGAAREVLPAASYSSSESFFSITHSVARNYNLTATASPSLCLPCFRFACGCSADKRTWVPHYGQPCLACTQYACMYYFSSQF